MQVASRYLTHALVLLSAILIPALSFGGGMRTHGSGPIVATLAADRTSAPTRGFIIKPVTATTTPHKREVQTYTVQDGDTVSGIGDRFGVRIDTIRWANNLGDVDTLSLGQKLLVPPVDGVLLTVKAGDSVEGLAAKYQVPTSTIIEFNLVRDPAHLSPGGQLMIPDGVGDPAPAPATSSTPRRSTSSRSSGSSAVISTGRVFGSGSGNFPWGYCTWYVSTRRYVPWSGNANQWFSNAQAYGYATGRSPRPGAIMVTWESWWGHVAYVESVDGSCWTVSEMNYSGFGRVDFRHICPGQVPLIGFVY